MTGMGTYIRTLREGQGITRAWVAERVGTSDTSVYRIEKGDQAPATVLLIGIVNAIRGSFEDVEELLRNDGAKAEKGKSLAESRLTLTQQARITAVQDEIGVDNAAEAATLIQNDPALRKAILRLADAMRGGRD